jgi:GNAT superfamily N-acetyltransferase
MKLTMRSYQDAEDAWRIREFLRQVMSFNHLHEYSWHIARWDYWIWFVNPDLEKIPLEENVFIWENGDGQIAAVLNPESRGQVFPHFHPAFRSPDLMNEVIAQAEGKLTFTGTDGIRKLWIWLDSQDKAQKEILTRRGFRRVEAEGEQEWQHRRWLDGPLPDVPEVPGYVIRPQGDGLELLERCYASGLGFHKDDINVARQNRDHSQWYHHIQTAPLYRRDLDLVAVAADGSIASFCTIWFDDVTRSAVFEPVATVPAHQRHGLSRAVLTEGLHRLKRMGCRLALVGGYSERANALYFSVMGPEVEINEPWEKQY